MIIGNWKWYTRIKKISHLYFFLMILTFLSGPWNRLEFSHFVVCLAAFYSTLDSEQTLHILYRRSRRHTSVSTGRCCIASMHSQSPVHVLAFLGENQSSRPLHPGCINYRPARISLQSAVRQVNIKPISSMVLHWSKGRRHCCHDWDLLLIYISIMIMMLFYMYNR